MNGGTMNSQLITKDNRRKYQEEFVIWMSHHYPNIKRPEIMASNVMYSINRDMGFSINDLIMKRMSIDEYVRKYTEYFHKINRKSPLGHAKVQQWCASYFIEYIRSAK
jgi:hypothetical protein